MLKHFKPIAKSIAPAIAAGVLGLYTCINAWLLGGVVTELQWRVAAGGLLAGIVHGVVVYFVPNAASPAEAPTWKPPIQM